MLTPTRANYWACRIISLFFKKKGFIYIVYNNETGQCNYVSNLNSRKQIAGIIGDLSNVMGKGEGVIEVH